MKQYAVFEADDESDMKNVREHYKNKYHFLREVHNFYLKIIERQQQHCQHAAADWLFEH